MRLNMEQRQAVVKKLSEKYKRMRKKEKRAMLDSVIELTGYQRDNAARLLLLYDHKLQKKKKERLFEKKKRVWTKPGSLSRLVQISTTNPFGLTAV